MSFTAGCLLLSLLLTTHSAAFRHGKVTLEQSSYCPIPEQLLGENQAVPPNFKTACKTHCAAERDKLGQAYEVIRIHVANLVNRTATVDRAFKPFLGVCVEKLHSPQFRDNNRQIDVLRHQIVVAAIEAGRISEAVTQYVISQSWEDWRSVMDRIYAHPKRHRKHIENLLAFVQLLPVRAEQLEYYHHLRGLLIANEDHESYLGALFAYGVRRVVFADDGKTALNKTDERELWTTIAEASAGYYKRSFLSGENRVELAHLDREFPDVFTMLFPQIVAITREDLRKFNGYKMTMIPCSLHRAHSKLIFFREALLLLQRHFTWKDHNHLHAPRMAGAFKLCLPHLEKEPKIKQLMGETKALFSKFEKEQTFETLLKTMEKRMNVLSIG